MNIYGNIKNMNLQEIEKELDVLAISDVPQSNHTTMIAIDFMAYVHRIPVAKLKLANYGAFLNICGAHLSICQESAKE